MLDISKYPRFANDSKLVKRLGFFEIEWRRACPDVDLQGQLGWCHYWLQTSDKGNKRKDMARTLCNWFKRCQKDIEAAGKGNGPIKVPSLGRFQEHKPDESEVMTGDDFKRIREAL